MRESLSFGGEVLLDNIETPEQKVAVRIEPLVSDYAIQPIERGFDWAGILTSLPEEIQPNSLNPGHLVAFRSIRKEHIDLQKLIKLDEDAHREAAGSPGFVFYFMGEPDEQGNCLSMCLWQSAEEGRVASGLPFHRAAVECAGEFYDSFDLELQRIKLDESHEGFSIYDKRIIPMHISKINLEE